MKRDRDDKAIAENLNIGLIFGGLSLKRITAMCEKHRRGLKKATHAAVFLTSPFEIHVEWIKAKAGYRPDE